MFPDWLRANGLDQSRCGLATKRPNREFLLSITMGKYSYEELVEQAEQKILQIDNAYQNSSLTDETNHYAIEKLLVEIRDKFYS